ncbi:MAG: hypothetical protein AB8F78_13860 [Saprospiraceae bacterium]
MLNRILAAATLLAITSVGCEPNVLPYSGTICITLEHHGVPHFGATVYRNYGDAFPGYHENMAANYDTVAETGLSNSVCFNNLSVGGHWFAAEGFDEFIQDSTRGSLFIELGTSQSRVDTVLKVSEQH